MYCPVLDWMAMLTGGWPPVWCGVTGGDVCFGRFQLFQTCLQPANHPPLPAHRLQTLKPSNANIQVHTGVLLRDCYCNNPSPTTNHNIRK